MLANRNSYFLMLIIALVSLACLSGCANQSAVRPFAAVRTFADETKQLSITFEPMLAGSSTSCADKYIRKKLITSSDFDPARVEKEAAEMCAPIAENNQAIARLNQLLEQYADTLAALADDKLPSYQAELGGLSASLGKLKKPGTQEALVGSDKLSAVTSLAEFLSRVATQHLQKDSMRELLNHEAAIQTITNALRDYATLNYRGWLRDERRENEVLYKALDRSKETLAANYLKTILLREDRLIAQRDQAIDAFVASLEQLQKANAEIRQKFDQQDDKALIAQLVNYAKEVSRLRRQMQGVF